MSFGWDFKGGKKNHLDHSRQDRGGLPDIKIEEAYRMSLRKVDIVGPGLLLLVSQCAEL